MADVVLPPIFSDKMILQQNSKNLLWGKADPNEKVSVSTSWCGVVKHTYANAEGNWKLFLGTPSYGTGFKITVKGNNTIEINDVAIGEVWLGIGQSNMGWAAKSTFNGSSELEKAKDFPIRIYRGERGASTEPEFSQDARWYRLDDSRQELLRIPGVSFFFVNKLYTSLEIPVGIIVEPYAGSPIEAWMPKDIQMVHQATADYVNGVTVQKYIYRNLTPRDIANGKTVGEWQYKTINSVDDYAGKLERCNQKHLDDPDNVPECTLPPFEENMFYPGAIYNGMVNPVVGYGIKGMIYYQGESNSDDFEEIALFESQMTMLIDYYRTLWNTKTEGNVDASFPFYLVQLPSWKDHQDLPVEEDLWPAMREVMNNITRDVANTGIAVGIDTGDQYRLHPKNKMPLGIRLAYHALKDNYGKNIVDIGPVYESYNVVGSSIELNFETQGATIVPVRPNEDINSFAVAGSDKVWHWADNVVIDGNKITVSSSEVSSPVAVRYAWAYNPTQRNLIYNEHGLPASPFRTDNWAYPAVTETYRPAKTVDPEGYEPVDWYRPEMPQ